MNIFLSQCTHICRAGCKFSSFQVSAIQISSRGGYKFLVLSENAMLHVLFKTDHNKHSSEIKYIYLQIMENKMYTEDFDKFVVSGQYTGRKLTL
jgi:hypothetical protein